MFTATGYVKVQSLEEAYELNQKKKNIIAGGMLWLKMSSLAYQTVIDLSGLGLDQIVETEDEIEMGCMVTLRQFETSKVLAGCFGNGPHEAVKHIVGTQFRNLATLGGSLFGRYGFSDVLTYLLALDAEVELYKRGRMPLCEFAKLPYDNDILVKIYVKKDGRRTAYQTYRNESTDFPVLTCAVCEKNGEWKAAIGATPKRATIVTMPLSGTGCSDEEIAEAAAKTAELFSYGSNMRGSAEYRKYLAKVLLTRCVKEIREEAQA